MTEELAFLSDAKPVTIDERAALVAKAEERVAERARLALEAAQNEGILSKSVRIVRKGASVLVALDVASRVYVWGVLEANPGLTPVVGYSAGQIRALLEP